MSKILTYDDLFNNIEANITVSEQILGNYYKLAYDEIEKELKDLYLKIYEMETRTDFTNNAERQDWYSRILQQKHLKDRYKKLQDQIEKQVFDLVREVRNNIIGTVNTSYIDSYNMNAFLIDKSAGVYCGFDIISGDQIKNAFRNSIGGLVNYQDNKKNMYSVTGSIWSDKEFMYVKYMINQEVTIGIMRGDKLQKTAMAIQDKIQQSYGRALRIARTETMRAYSDSTEQVYQDAINNGVELRKVWQSALIPGRTRDTHAAMDGVPADKDGIFTIIGTSIKTAGPHLTGHPEHDINCMCSIIFKVVDVDEGLKSKDNTMPFDITYEEWKKAA